MSVVMLSATGHGECANCGRPITRLTSDASDGDWEHDPQAGSGFQRHCPGSPVAEPASEGGVGDA